MRAYKEKQFIVFEFEDGKNVKYNLSNGETIGKHGRLVKDIKTQLSGKNLVQVIDSFPDNNYRNFLKFLDEKIINISTSNSYWGRRGRVDKVKNIGTFLGRIQGYSRFEQIFACGITKVDRDFTYKINEIPKGLLKLCKERNIFLNDNLVCSYKRHTDLFNNIFKTEFISITDLNIISLLVVNESQRYYGDYSSRLQEKFFSLINQYNYNPISLLKHIDNLMTYEALERFDDTITEFEDYVRMMSRISNKYEKYPKNFLTTHKIAVRNYNRLKEHFKEESFTYRINKKLEYQIEEYKIIYPNSTQDIKDEAVQQNNCVASYIQKVIDGDCHILFLRKKDNIDKSLITLEVRNNKVVQAKGKFNRDLNSDEQEIVEKYNQRLLRILKEEIKNAS